AERLALPHFCILNSKIIAELARKRPTTEAELRLIPGISDRRIAKYGDTLLALIRTYEAPCD
ncbi:MAG: HRDC domain-containing protein, partial [Kiritimatiellae bacterium]|nr:HRDC domain-containing protein [Kiritimatiellia bacterium]